MSEVIPTVFLSSTAKDLTEFRAAVHAALTKGGRFKCIWQEDFGGEHAETVARCTQAAASADIFVGLIGMRRGWEPAPDQRSITEMEYDNAKPEGRFIYVTPDSFPVPGNLRESDEEHQRQLAFRKRVKGRIASMHDFKSAHQLANDIVQELLAKQAAPTATSPELVDALVAALEQKGFVKKADAEGLERQTVIKLAQRLRPSDTLDFDQAAAALENAVTIALDAIARGERNSNEEQFIQDVLSRIAHETKAGRFDAAAKEVDDALVFLDQREAEQRETLQRNRLTLLESGIEQDILRRDPMAVARRVARIATVAHPNNQKSQFKALCTRQHAFYVEGQDKGINLSSEVAIAIAGAAVDLALDASQRGTAFNCLGNALWTLGGRESGTERLEQAIAVYRDALLEHTRERAPLDWATTKNNLGNALATLGDREDGTEKLEQAVAVYRDALLEHTRERVPLDWAMTQNNLGNALQTLAERETGTERLEQAIAAYRDALLEYTRERAPFSWAMTQNNLGNALKALGARESGTERLEQAVAAYRDALLEYTRERVPPYWAMTQNNLGTALYVLGARESGTERLELAVAAYRDALLEYTRERVPLDWAMSSGNQGMALVLLAERTGDIAMAERAVGQIKVAFTVSRDGGHAVNAANYESWLPTALAALTKLQDQAK